MAGALVEEFKRAQIRALPVNRWLFRVGTVRCVGGDCSVVFHRGRCAGCEGRCGVSLGGRRLPVDFGLPDGTPVEVAVSVHDMARRALVVFGWPLGAVGAAAAVTEWLGLSEGLMVAALLGTALAVVGVRAASVNRDTLAAPQACRRTAGPEDGVRVVLE